MLDFSAFRPKVISEFASKYNGQIRVKQDLDGRYVSVDNLTQSGGLVKEVWQPVIKKFGKKDKTWLILGLGAGTAAKLIPQPARIAGIEIDPVMIAIGKNYFDLGSIPNLKIIKTNAKDYALKTKDQFDFILVDLYLGDKCPDFVYQKRFLEKLRKVGKIVIINHLFYDEDKRLKAEELVKKLNSIFKNIHLLRVLTNTLIICS